MVDSDSGQVNFDSHRDIPDEFDTANLVDHGTESRARIEIEVEKETVHAG